MGCGSSRGSNISNRQSLATERPGSISSSLEGSTGQHTPCTARDAVVAYALSERSVRSSADIDPGTQQQPPEDPSLSQPLSIRPEAAPWRLQSMDSTAGSGGDGPSTPRAANTSAASMGFLPLSPIQPDPGPSPEDDPPSNSSSRPVSAASSDQSMRRHTCLGTSPPSAASPGLGPAFGSSPSQARPTWSPLSRSSSAKTTGLMPPTLDLGGPASNPSPQRQRRVSSGSGPGPMPPPSFHSTPGSRPSSAGTDLSSRPSSAASRPPKSPQSELAVAIGRLAPPLDMQMILQRQLSRTSRENSPRPPTPRSPVTLLPHSPVLRTPRSPLQPGGVALCGVPQLPAHYVPRDSELSQARKLLLDGNSVVLIGPEGMGGVGKSTLAAALARDEAIQEAYRDGVFWLMLGPKVNPMIKAEELKVTMAMQRLKLPLWVPMEETTTPESMQVWFRQTLAGRRCMLILDNCSHSSELEAFRDTGLVLLATTRDPRLSEELGAQQCSVPLVFGDLAPKILSAAAGTPHGRLSSEESTILGSYGGLPLELTMVGGLLKGKQSSSWPDVLAKLHSSDADLDALYGSDAQQMSASTAQLLKTLAAALELLPGPIQPYYRRLAVLPDGVYTPIHMLKRLWGMGSKGDVREVCQLLAARSLVTITKADDGCESITVHDVQLDFLRHRHSSELPAWHSALVEGYSLGLDHIASVVDDGYIVNHIAHHLKGGQHFDTLRELLYDTDWLERKLHNHGVRAVMDDFRRYLEDRRDPQVHTLCQAFALAAPAALSHPSLAMLGVQMAGRLLAHANQPLIPDWILFIRELLNEDNYSTGTAPLWPMAASLGQVGGGLLTTLKGHSSWVTGLVISPDNSWVASCSTDRTVRLWNLSDGSLKQALAGHDDHVTAMAVVPGNQQLLTCSRDRTGRLWDVSSGAETAQLVGHTGGITACCICSAEGTRDVAVTAADDMTARVWGLDGELLHALSGHSAMLRSVICGPCGRLAVTGSDDHTARVWDVASGVCLQVLRGHTDKVGGLAAVACPDSARGQVLTLSTDFTSRLWDLSTGSCLLCLRGHKAGVSDAAISPDGLRAVTVSGDKTARVWDLSKGACLHVLSGHSNWVNGVAVYGGGRRAITVSVDRQACIWDLETGVCTSTLQGHTSVVAAVAVTSDSQMAVTVSSDKTARLWSLRDGVPMYGCGHRKKMTDVVMLPYGDRCISVGHDGIPTVWDCTTGMRATTALPMPEGQGQPPQSLTAVTAAGNSSTVLAAAGNEAWLWDLGFMAQQPRLAHVLRGHSSTVQAVALSWKGDVAFTASGDKTARVWDSATGHCRHVLKGHSGGVAQLAVLARAARRDQGGDDCFLPPGARTLSALATASLDGTARVWDPSTGECLATLEGHGAELTACVAAPASEADDGESALVTASQDSTLRFWTDTATVSKTSGDQSGASRRWQCSAELRGHSSAVTAVVVVRCQGETGRARALSGAEDGSLLVWDLWVGQLLHTLDVHTGPVRCISVGTSEDTCQGNRPHPGGALVVTASEDCCAIVWDAESMLQLGLFEADRPLTAAALSLVVSPSTWATVVAGDAQGNVHMLELPAR